MKTKEQHAEALEQTIAVTKLATKFVNDNKADFAGLTEAVKKVMKQLREEKIVPFEPNQFEQDILNTPTEHEYKPVER